MDSDAFDRNRFSQMIRDHGLTSNAHKIIIEGIKGEVAGLYILETLKGFVSKAFRACVRSRGYLTNEIDLVLHLSDIDVHEMSEECLAFALALNCELKEYDIPNGKAFDVESSRRRKARRLLGYSKESNRDDITLCASYYHEVLMVVLGITQEYLESEGYTRKSLEANRSLITKEKTFVKIWTRQRNPSNTFLVVLKQQLRRNLTRTVLYCLSVFPPGINEKVKLFKHEKSISVDPDGLLEKDLVSQLRVAYLESLTPVTNNAQDDDDNNNLDDPDFMPNTSHSPY